jgi:hypothetical protein
VETSGGDSENFYKTGCTISLMAAVQPEPWFRALITNNNNKKYKGNKNRTDNENKRAIIHFKTCD